MRNDIAWIPISNSQWVKVSLEDLEKIISIPWSISPHGYAKHSKHGLMHRLLLDAVKGSYVDHINGDRLDNTRENLRLCTHSQNLRNRGATASSKSGWKGVSTNKPHTDRWRATITADCGQVHVGYFDSSEDAATAYNFAAYELHGEFAQFNTVPQPWLEEAA